MVVQNKINLKEEIDEMKNQGSEQEVVLFTAKICCQFLFGKMKS